MGTPNHSVIPISLRASIEDTFRMQVGIETHLKVSTVSAEAAQAAGANLDIVSVMGIKCTGYVGTLALGFPAGTFLGVVETMLGEVHKEVSGENSDACSELLNIIYAGARTKINGDGFDFQPAIPSTVCGKQVWLPMNPGTTFLQFAGETAKGTFVLAFALKRTE